MYSSRINQSGRPCLWRKAPEDPTFTLFQLLPTELRLQIWELSLPRPRNYYVPSSNYLVPEAIQLSDPVAMRVNRESREVALQHYTLRDPRALDLHRKLHNTPCSPYIDFTNDRVVYLELRQFALTKNFWHEGTFYSGSCTAADIPENFAGMRFFTRAELGKIANLAILSGDFTFKERDLTRWLHDWLPVFGGLKEFEFWITPGDFDSVDPDVFRTWYREVWSVKRKSAEYTELMRDAMEAFREQKIMDGLNWEAPSFKVDILRLKPVKEAAFKFTFEL